MHIYRPRQSLPRALGTYTGAHARVCATRTCTHARTHTHSLAYPPHALTHPVGEHMHHHGQKVREGNRRLSVHLHSLSFSQGHRHRGETATERLEAGRSQTERRGER